MSNDKDNFNVSGLAAALKDEDRAGLVNALKNKLQNLAGQHSDVLENLTPKIRRRVEVLREIQDKHDEIVNHDVGRANEGTVLMALKVLMVHEKNESSSTVQMAELGAIDALLDLLRSHQCEEESGSLLEVIFNNPRVRELKLCKYAIAPLSQYLLDPQTRSDSGRLLAALALGDLSQHEGLSRSSGCVSAFRALISVIEEQPTEGMKVVAICALQNFVMNSRTNRRAVAEAGGVFLIQELLLSCNAEVSGQAALMIKFLFSNHTLQELT